MAFVETPLEFCAFRYSELKRQSLSQLEEKVRKAVDITKWKNNTRIKRASLDLVYYVDQCHVASGKEK